MQFSKLSEMWVLEVSAHVTQLLQALIIKGHRLGMTFHPEQGNTSFFGLGHSLCKGLLQLP